MTIIVLTDIEIKFLKDILKEHNNKSSEHILNKLNKKEIKYTEGKEL